MKYCVSLLFFLVSVAFSLSCWAFSPYSHPYTYNVEGSSFSCRDLHGTPVQIREDPRLPDVGMASYFLDGYGRYYPYIVLNPAFLARYDKRVKMFWFAHECGHHFLGHIYSTFMGGPRNFGAEKETDCYAVRILRRQYGFSRGDIQAIAFTLINNPGSAAGHLPGPARARHLDQCAAY